MGPFAPQSRTLSPCTLRPDYFGDKGLPELLVEMQEQSQDLAMSAVGGCVSYLRSCLMDTELVSMRNFKRYEDFDDGGMGKLIVDGQTLANLEILESEGGKGHSLIDRMDRFLDYSAPPNFSPTNARKHAFMQQLISPPHFLSPSFRTLRLACQIENSRHVLTRTQTQSRWVSVLTFCLPQMRNRVREAVVPHVGVLAPSRCGRD